MYEGLEKLAFKMEDLKKKEVIIPAIAGGVGTGAGVLGFKVIEDRSLTNMWRKRTKAANDFVETISKTISPGSKKWTKAINKGPGMRSFTDASKHAKIFGASMIGHIARAIVAGAAVGVPAYLGVRAIMNRRNRNKPLSIKEL